MLKLAVFDLDGTLKTVRDPYVYLHERLGTLAAAEEFTGKGLSGQIPYEEWLRLDTGLWRGVRRSVLVNHLHAIPYVPGVHEVVAALRARGVTLAIVSSGLLLHAELVAAELGMDLVVGNEILFEDDGPDPAASGQVRAHCAYGNKNAVLARMQAELGLTPAETLAMGDTRSDIGLFERAAVSVAVNPQDARVAEAATIVLPNLDLGPLLPALDRVWPM
jgi:phosphoserine phosphatase